jgi:hypothetical protein
VKSRNLPILTAVLMTTMAAWAGSSKEAPGQTIDSGTLGVFQGGRRIATETFSIQQSTDGSRVSSEFKTDSTGNDAARQTSELELAPNGDLRKYEWKELSPGKVQAVVAPNDTFLMQRTTMNPEEKPQEQPYIMPASTSIMDDYCFIHREILAWRYMATACRQNKGKLECPSGQRTQMGVVVPHGRTSMLVGVEFAGREKVQVHGAERELNRFNLKGDGPDWALWLDDQFRLVRIFVKDEQIEIVRD